MVFRSSYLCLLITLAMRVCAGGVLLSAEPNQPELEAIFRNNVAPFLKTYCHSCHGSTDPKAKLDLTAFSSTDRVASAHGAWEMVRERLVEKEMPPDDAPRQPAPEERQIVIQWIDSFRELEAKRNAGDPGIVPVRRLNNAEYNYTIRDLTGVDIRPAREFPVDPANEAGFDNSAQSLSMSPALAKKYVEAARLVVDHLVLKPKGFAFAPHPVVTDTDRDKYCVRRIVDFYQRQATDLADYFHAAWMFKHRAAVGQEGETLDSIAAKKGVSSKYLATIWTALTQESFDVGPMAKLQTLWRDLPPPANEGNDCVREGCVAMRDFVNQLRRKLEPKVANLESPRVHDGSQPLVLWKNRQYAANRRTYSREALEIEGLEGIDPDLAVPADEAQRARHEASFARFCSDFPDAFFVSERGRDYVGKPREQQEKGRLLSAGFHSQMGYFRDDGPLYEMVLDSEQQAEIDILWDELDFVANAPLRQYQGFLWFDRTDSRFMRDPQFDFARAEDKDAASEDKIRRLSVVYVEKARENGGGDAALAAIETYFRDINARVRWVEQARVAAEPSHLVSLVTFAERAFRRPLTTAERENLLAFYRSMREREAATHEEAIQDAIVYVLMSPHFCYRMDLASAQSRDGHRGGAVVVSRNTGPSKEPLSNYELASRLSYFLWSSMPDKELLSHAAAGDLAEPAVLAAQTRRMLQDDKIRALAVEFGGHWLDFRRFEEHNSVDRERFPTFTNELRAAMFEEPIRFFIDLVQRDGSALEFLYARHTFVNRTLAEHYDLPDLVLDRDQWVRFDDAADFSRGGLLPMAAFLTQNSPGLRTSPVKRGYWVVRRLLGERIPPPPNEVPELPADEAKLGNLTLRETLAKHREHASCAGCHQRFDSFGLVFEGYGPIGERREIDLGGRPVDTTAEFPGGGEGKGLEGLRNYVRQHRQDDFLDNLCRKLLSYALGRTLLPSDDSLIREIRQKLAASDHRFGVLIESIVTSPQFLTKRANVGQASSLP